MSGVHLAAVVLLVGAIVVGLSVLSDRLADRRAARDWTVSDACLDRLERLRQQEANR